MKLNEQICIIGRSVVLVPYKEHHVAKYHNWMKSKELQTLTASEELSMTEEYEMQRTWHEDENKCTFIILDKITLDAVNDEIESMIGDTNLFVSDCETKTAEAEIMIAESNARGNRRGWEAILIMLRYGCEELNIEKYEAKIGFNNTPSIELFKKIGFFETSRSEVFSEITFQKPVTPDWIQWLRAETPNIVKVNYHAKLKSDFKN